MENELKKAQFVFEQTFDRYNVLLHKVQEKGMFNVIDFISYVIIKGIKMFPPTESFGNETKEERLDQFNKVLDIVEAEIEAYGEKLN